MTGYEKAVQIKEAGQGEARERLLALWTHLEDKWNQAGEGREQDALSMELRGLVNGAIALGYNTGEMQEEVWRRLGTQD